MTGPRPAEDRIALWLEEGAVGALPDRVLDATFDRTHTLRQARRSAWRPFPMSRPIPALIAVGAAAIIIVAGVVYFRPAPTGNVGVSPPSPSPTTSAPPIVSPSVSADLLDVSTWTAFTSSRYGFSARYPATFHAVPSTTSWRMPDTPGNMFDGFQGSGAVKWLNGMSTLLPAGATLDDWYAEYRRDLVEDGDPWEPETCFTPREEWSSTTVDGHAADLRVGCEALEAFVFVSGRVYVFGAYAYEGITPPTTDPGVTDEHRDLFELWLTTITLDPSSAQQPALTPMPSST